MNNINTSQCHHYVFMCSQSIQDILLDEGSTLMTEFDMVLPLYYKTDTSTIPLGHRHAGILIDAEH